jgi:hypothetical protein
MSDVGVAADDYVTVNLAPEGPQRGDLADDSPCWRPIPPPLRSSTRWAQFYRKAHIRWIDATTRRPDLRGSPPAERTGRPG